MPFNDDGTYTIPRCLLCFKPAITTAAHLPVCEEHWREYEDEAKQYLSYEQRLVYQRLLAAQTVRDMATHRE